MLPEFREAYGLARQTHERLYNLLREAERTLTTTPDLAEQVDAAYAMRETAKLLDDTRKDASRLCETASKIACAIAIKSGSADTIRTEYVSATPKMDMAPAVPNRRRDPEQYRAFCAAVGIPEALVNVDENASQVFELHWPGLVSHFTALMEEGKPLPPGVRLDQTYPVYKLSMRGRKEVDAEN